MNHPSDLLLTVWQEASRHVHIKDSLSGIGNVLIHRMSLDGVFIRTIDFKRNYIQTLASHYRNTTANGITIRSTLTQHQMVSLQEWLNSSEILQKKQLSDPVAELHHIFPEGLEGDMLAGPLQVNHSSHGIIILQARRGHSLILDHKTILKDLLEPFRTAFRNHHKYEEIKILKETVEADSNVLPSRFGRSDIGDEVIGAKKGLKSVMEKVELVASSDTPVLIFGETGAGKEVIARAIHQKSDRNNAPFLRVNCGAIPAELIDSELFGHERGSFTGAIDTRKGWFERADGGTLFLDEVGELPHAAQVRLLRVLQDGTFERVGGGNPLQVDVRIVAATHRNLTDMVNQKKFREDLWYRIAVFPVDLPPLRDRREDIPDLARHFAIKASQTFGVPSKALSDSALSLLLSYDWPGNVRELSSVIERATILSKGLELDIETALGIQPKGKIASNSELEKKTTNSFPTLDIAMREHIEEALKITKGRVEGPFGAAELLDINPHTLRGRMRKLDVDWRDFRPE